SLRSTSKGKPRGRELAMRKESDGSGKGSMAAARPPRTSIAGARERSGRPEFVAALAHGLEVLQVFDERHAEMSLVEVARLTGLTPATARRSLHTLIELGYVRSINKRFVLTPHVLSL